MNNFKPIKQIKASDEVFNQLREAIFSGRFSAGDKLPSERELIETFAVSRTVVREAIKSLEARGLVVIKQGATGGAFVKEMTFERLSSDCNDLFFLGKMSFNEICQARLHIEPIVAGLAAKHCTPEHAKLLLEANDNESLTLQYPQTIKLRSQVHYLLADMCNNRFLTAIDKSLIQLVGSITSKFQPDTDKIHPAGMHNSIIDAVIAGDEKAAEKAMREHLLTFLTLLENIEAEFRENQ
ncbi:FadR family transcriptional regulator [Shewanella inventionis]|uniref:GntR family transcriptional regulator n=1 Tax=Shewanella inventionis TaxID=1738770 RepID=A0ABQ1JSB9_9GAMM|nr:FadR/GntR family transcriptional regulator [Shewanella inventionis]MCL1159714.1 FadR family transcriptional regulator [Shewanella inventionis]UAL44442.1 FadR family transcriptional regulator [Shewanella inventionis]GGB73757.1 GntR family transcriptional regulator [Shewanella inventionis]